MANRPTDSAATVQHIETQLAIRWLELRVEQINQQLHDDELHLYLSGSPYCVIVLMDIATRTIRLTFGVDVRSPRDMGLTKGFLQMVENAHSTRRLAAA